MSKSRERCEKSEQRETWPSHRRKKRQASSTVRSQRAGPEVRSNLPPKRDLKLLPRGQMRSVGALATVVTVLSPDLL